MVKEKNEYIFLNVLVCVCNCSLIYKKRTCPIDDDHGDDSDTVVQY